MQKGPNPNDIVGVQCPRGHDLYPKGVKVSTLWKNNGIRFTDRQKIVPTEAERQMWFVMSPYYRQGDKRPEDGHPEHYKNGCYRLTEEQYAWVGIKCKECPKK